MKFATFASAAALASALASALALGACAGQTGTEAGRETTSVADDRFDYAVNFTCEGGGKLDVVFHQPEGAALARVDGGAAMTLKPDMTDGSGQAWKSEAAALRLEGPGASWTADGATRSCEFQSRSLPPPKAEGVTQTLTVADAGKAVEVKVGEKVAVALVGVPTAGYVWAASTPPAFVKASDGPGGSTTTSQFLPGFAGGSHWEVVIIEAIAAGEGEITLAQRRPWENTAEADATTFKFKLKAS